MNGRVVPCALAAAFLLPLLATMSVAAEITSSVQAELKLEPLPIRASVDQNRLLSTPTSWRVSNDGAFLAYVLSKDHLGNRLPASGVNWTEKGVYLFDIVGSKLHVLDVERQHDTLLSTEHSTDWGAAWSPDGRYLAFYSDRDGAARLWLWDRAENDFRRVSDEIVHADFLNQDQAPTWSSDGRRLIVPLLPQRLTLERLSRTDSLKERSSDISAPTATTYLSGQKAPSTPMGYSNYQAPDNEVDLAAVDVETGHAHRFFRDALISYIQVVGEGAGSVFFAQLMGQKAARTYTWIYDVYRLAPGATRPERILANVEQLTVSRFVAPSQDGQAVAFCTARPHVPGRERGQGSCYWQRLGIDKAPRLASDEHHAFSGLTPPRWSRDGKRIFVGSHDGVWEIELKARGLRKVVAVPGRRITQFVLSNRADGHESLWVVVATEGGLASTVQEWDVATGDVKSEHRTRGLLDKLTVVSTPRGVRLFSEQQTVRSYPDIWMARGSFADETRLTRTNPDLEGYELGQTRILEYADKRGRVLRAALLLPADYRSSRLYPLIVTMYPDARLHRSANRWRMGQGAFDPQLAATRGYAVLAVDTVIETGTLMQDIVRGVNAGVDKAIAEQVADPTRLAVMGTSFGGYSVFAVITQTQRFRAAIEDGGFANALTQYGAFTEDGNLHHGTATFEEGRSLGGTPWTVREKYIENSPVWFLDRINTPLLMIHGTEDTAVRVNNADEAFAYLRRLGKTVEYARYRGEGHKFLLYANCVDRAERILRFLDEQLDVARDEAGRVTWEGGRAAPR